MWDPQKMSRRNFLKMSGMATGAMLVSGVVPNSFAKREFPYKQMQTIVGFKPGGGTDRSARVIAIPWAKTLGADKPFKFNYLPGAGGTIAMKKTMNSPPDGHVLLFTPAPHVAWTFELHKLAFGIKDIEIIGSYFTDPDVLLVRKDAKWDRIDQFIEDARKTKVPFTVSVSTPMSAAHAATVVLRELSGAKLKVVPFEGGSQSRNAVAGGHVTACMAPYWSATHVLELTKAIGIFYDHNPAPNLWKPVPANEVLDFKMPYLTEPYSVVCHGHVKSKYPERYEKLVTTMRRTCESKEMRDLADKQNLTPFLKYMSPEESGQWMDEYLKMLAKFIPAMKADLKKMM